MVILKQWEPSGHYFMWSFEEGFSDLYEIVGETVWSRGDSSCKSSCSSR